MRSIDQQIIALEKELQTVKRNESESFYNPYRERIEEMQERAIAEFKRLNQTIPSYITEKKNEFKIRILLYLTGALTTGVLGGIGATHWGLDYLQKRESPEWS